MHCCVWEFNWNFDTTVLYLVTMWKRASAVLWCFSLWLCSEKAEERFITIYLVLVVRARVHCILIWWPVAAAARPISMHFLHDICCRCETSSTDMSHGQKLWTGSHDRPEKCLVVPANSSFSSCCAGSAWTAVLSLAHRDGRGEGTFQTQIMHGRKSIITSNGHWFSRPLGLQLWWVVTCTNLRQWNTWVTSHLTCLYK